MAALQDVTNTSGVSIRKCFVDVHVCITEEYAYCKHAYSKESLAHQVCHAQRLEGKKNVDLWVDGCLYPLDPAFQASPPFRDLSSFLRFVGEGEKGLLGYCKRLSTYGGYQIQYLHSQVQEMQLALHQSQQSLQEVNHKLQELEASNASKSLCIQNLEDTLKRVKSTPGGGRERKRKLLGIETLAACGGARKRRIHATKDFLWEACGSSDEGWKNLLRACVKPSDVKELLQDPMHNAIQKEIRACCETGRPIQQSEECYAYKHGTNALYEKLEAEATPIFWENL